MLEGPVSVVQLPDRGLQLNRPALCFRLLSAFLSFAPCFLIVPLSDFRVLNSRGTRQGCPLTNSIWAAMTWGWVGACQGGKGPVTSRYKCRGRGETAGRCTLEGNRFARVFAVARARNGHALHEKGASREKGPGLGQRRGITGGQRRAVRGGLVPLCEAQAAQRKRRERSW